MTDLESHAYVAGTKLFIIMASITTVCFLVFLDSAIIPTAIPKITNDFKSLHDIGWYASAFQVATATLQPLAGQWSFIGFFLIFELGSLVCGAATSSMMLIAGRAIAGMGSSGILNGGITIISGCVPPNKRATLTGTMIAISQLGLVSGPLVGGVLTEFASWRWCFYINLPIGAVILVLLVLCRIPDQILKPPARTIIPSLHRYIDLIGFIAIAGATLQLLFALELGGKTYPWKSATIISLFCTSALSFLAFGAWNWRKGDRGLIPFAIAKQRLVWTSAMTMSVITGTMFIQSYFLPIYFQAILDASPVQSGVYLLPSILSQLLFAGVCGVFVGKFGYFTPWAIAGGVLASCGNGLLTTLSATTSTAQWAGYQVLVGISRGVAIQIPVVAIQTCLPESNVSIATAVLVFAQYLGSAIYLTASTSLFNNRLLSKLSQEVPSINAAVVVSAGATAFRRLVPAGLVDSVVKVYAESISQVFYIAVALSVLVLPFALLMGREEIRRIQLAHSTSDLQDGMEMDMRRTGTGENVAEESEIRSDKEI